MIGFLQNIKALNFCWIFMALFMLNISIDVADTTPPDKKEDLSYNEQESIAELILEKILGFDDIIPESEDNDPVQESTLKKATGIDHFIIPPVVKEGNENNIAKNKHLFRKHFFLTGRFTEIIAPPPEV